MSPLYDMSVVGIPLFIRGLENMTSFLKKAEKWADENKVSHSKLLEGKLAEDMLPLTFQIQTCSNTTKGVLVRLAGMEATPMEDDEKTFDDLYKRIDKTIDVLKKADAKSFQGKEESEVRFKAGPYDLKFTGLTYLSTFVIPNFYFHMTTAYNILRKEGAPVGKMDYLGSIPTA